MAIFRRLYYADTLYHSPATVEGLDSQTDLIKKTNMQSENDYYYLWTVILLADNLQLITLIHCYDSKYCSAVRSDTAAQREETIRLLWERKFM